MNVNEEKGIKGDEMRMMKNITSNGRIGIMVTV
jgi:hypothetical protein